MSPPNVELRSWFLITISFLLGMLFADFVDVQWQARAESSQSIASVRAATSLLDPDERTAAEDLP